MFNILVPVVNRASYDFFARKIKISNSISKSIKDTLVSY